MRYGPEHVWIRKRKKKVVVEPGESVSGADFASDDEGDEEEADEEVDQNVSFVEIENGVPYDADTDVEEVDDDVNVDVNNNRPDVDEDDVDVDINSNRPGNIFERIRFSCT